MTDTFGTVARQIPLDPTIMDINMVMVLDYPEYTQGLLARLPDTVRNPAILKELSERHQGMADGYDQHPLEIDIQEEDIRKLLIASCIIAGAAAVVINKPVLAELTEDSGKKILKFDRTDNLRHVWQLPHLRSDIGRGRRAQPAFLQEIRSPTIRSADVRGLARAVASSPALRSCV